MPTPDYDRFADMLDSVINEGGGSWHERAQSILDACDSSDLQEFLCWFEVDDAGNVVVGESGENFQR